MRQHSMNARPQISLDIETLGKGSRAPILSIGACFFHPRGRLTQREFYMNIQVDHALEEGLFDLDVSSFYWWMQQSDGARLALTKARFPLRVVLERFAGWATMTGAPAIWGNGNTFDNVILRNAYQAAGMGKDYPAHFKHDYDLRTLISLAETVDVCYDDPSTEGTHHNALDDAKYQALKIQNILEAIDTQNQRV